MGPSDSVCKSIFVLLFITFFSRIMSLINPGADFLPDLHLISRYVCSASFTQKARTGSCYTPIFLRSIIYIQSSSHIFHSYSFCPLRYWYLPLFLISVWIPVIHLHLWYPSYSWFSPKFLIYAYILYDLSIWIPDIYQSFLYSHTVYSGYPAHISNIQLDSSYLPESLIYPYIL